MPRAAQTTSRYDVRPGVAMVQNTLAKLKEKTGRDLDEWIAFIKQRATHTIFSLWKNAYPTRYTMYSDMLFSGTYIRKPGRCLYCSIAPSNYSIHSYKSRCYSLLA